MLNTPAPIAADPAPDTLQIANRLFDGRQMREARAGYQQAIEEGRRAPAGLAMSYRRLGILEATFNEPDLALRSFQRTLAINPTQEVPDSLSPSQQALFRAVRDGQREPASIQVAQQPAVSGIALETTTRGLPDGWVTVYRASTESWTTSGEDPAIAVPMDAFRDASSITVRVEGLDAFGNVVVRSTVEVVRPVSPGRVPGPEQTAGTALENEPIELNAEPDEEQSGRPALWIGVTIAAVLVVTAAVVIPLALRSNESPNYGTPIVEW